MRRQVDHDGLLGPSSCWAGHRCPRRQRHEEFLAPCVKHPAVYCKF